MNKTRRGFLLICVGGLAAPLTGCLTSKLYEPDHYSETISSVLLTQDGKQLVVIGKDFHYIFDVPEIISKVLSGSFRPYVTASFSHFNSDAEGKVAGNFTLYLSKTTPESEKEKALIAGFSGAPDGQLLNKGSLSGLRYASNGIQPTLASQKLNGPYTIDVNQPQSNGKMALKILATPVTVTVDGVLVLATIPLAIISIGLLGTLCFINGGKGCS